MILFVVLALPSPPDDKNVSLDDERLQDAIPKGLQKVELDLDDALFLEFEEEEPPPAQPQPEDEDAASAATEDADKEHTRRHGLPLWKKKSFLALLGLALLGIAASVFWLLKMPETGSETAQNASTPKKNAPAQTKPPTPIDGVQGQGGAGSGHARRRTYSFQPFVVEYVHENQTRFLTCQLSVPGTPGSLTQEMDAKTTPIRDGIFRFLKKTGVTDLSDPENEKRFKNELLAVINTFLENGQASDILIEGYVVK